VCARYIAAFMWAYCEGGLKLGESKTHLLIMDTSRNEYNKLLHNVMTMYPPKNRVMSKSYAGEVMAVCVSNEAGIAVDIERERHREDETINYFYNGFKTFTCNDMPPAGKLRDFYKLWTAMESFVKFRGQGLRGNMDFHLNLSEEAVYVGDEITAHLHYISFRDYCLCLCCDKPPELLNLKITAWAEGG